jgi:hypothetical protein
MSGKVLRNIINNGEKKTNKKINSNKKRGITKRNIDLISQFVEGKINLATADSKTKTFIFNNINEISKFQKEKDQKLKKANEEQKLLKEKQYC